MDKKPIDPIPTNFNSLEEAGEFWDTHDTTDYPEAFKSVEVHSQLRHRFVEVEIDMVVAEALRIRARQQGVSTSDLATRLLRQQLSA